MTGGEIELTGYAKVEDVKKGNEATLSSAKTYTDSQISELGLIGYQLMEKNIV